MYVPKIRRSHGFQRQLVRESIIAMLALSILVAVSMGGNSNATPEKVNSSIPPPIESVDIPAHRDLGKAKALPDRPDYFDGRRIQPIGTVQMRVTAYSPDHRSCGKFADGITASGYSVRTNAGHLVAADTELFPFGSLLSVPGYACGEVVPVLDRGSAIKGTRLDVLYPEHDQAIDWGVRTLNVQVWEYVDEGLDGLEKIANEG